MENIKQPDPDRVPRRGYSKLELAKLYYPGLSDRYAMKMLLESMRGTRGLMNQLTKMGYRCTKRFIERRFVEVIFDKLGEP